jgi:protein disulfide-isomerase
MKRRVAGGGWRVSRGGLIAMAGVLLLCGCNQTEQGEEPSAALPEKQSLWLADHDAALKQAAAENKYVLIDFSGSDWCGWCIKLDNEVFSKPEFTAYAKDNLILVLLDFPRSKPQPDEIKARNNQLAQKYSIQGFPTVLILDPQGKVIKRTGYQQGGPGSYIEMIKGVIAGSK